MKVNNHEQKIFLRKEILCKRNSMSQSQISMKSKLIQQRTVESMDFVQAKLIGLYLSMGSEVLTSDIINYVLKSEKTLMLPRIVSNELQFYIVEQKDFEKNLFDVNRFGIKEPKATNLIADFIDLLVIPGIAFDKYGYRVGYGYGYYDRFLIKHKIPKIIGLAYDFQFIDRIPTLSHDRKIDILITESRSHIFNTL